LIEERDSPAARFHIRTREMRITRKDNAGCSLQAEAREFLLDERNVGGFFRRKEQLNTFETPLADRREKRLVLSVDPRCPYHQVHAVFHRSSALIRKMALFICQWLSVQLK